MSLRTSGEYQQPPPPRRNLQIFAFDPLLGRTSRNRITVSVPYEPLLPGPVSDRIAVIDYDGPSKRYYQPIDLDETNVAMTSGLSPSESDPRFHQQMVYAVARCVLENFDVALGRRLRFRKGRPLRIFPHAMAMANAFYEPRLTALLFGYFRTSLDNPAAGIPGQAVFTCLSHDIVAHETTHALVDRLRPLYIHATNSDVAAFHEGFSDIVAIFQHFSFPGILRDTIQESRAALHESGPMVELAREFGYATGQGTALRTAVRAPDPRLYVTEFEAHDRGSILVSAVFSAFFTVYQRRIKDLVRLATGGSGQLPPGDLPIDLVNRVAGEAARTAQAILTMCIRAFEYLPPVDIRFGDYLRALVTADFELNPEDEFGLRAAIIESFHARGIYPPNVASLAEHAVLLENFNLPPLPLGEMQAEFYGWLKDFSRNTAAASRYAADSTRFGESDEEREGDDRDLGDLIIGVLKKYAVENSAALGLAPENDRRIAVRGFHPSIRVAKDGQLLVELVAQFTQKGREADDEGGVPRLAGVTIVASADGRIRYVARKPLPHPSLDDETNRVASERLNRQVAFVASCDARDARLALGDAKYRSHRIAMRTNFGVLHGGRSR